MDAIFFGRRTGCQGNALKETGICSSSCAHRRVPEGTEAGVCLGLWKSGLAADDALTGIDWAWRAMDGAMPKAPRGGAHGGKNPTERGKLGATRRVLTEGGGVPIGRAGEGAKRHACTMVRETIASIAVKRPAPTPATPQGMCVDKGNDDDEVRDLLAACGFTAHIRARGEAAQALKQDAGCRARRWVVERTPRWMNRFRRVLIRWDKKVRNYLGFLHLACASITYRQSDLLG